MKIDFDAKICNLEGLQLKMDGTDLTLKVCAISALFSNDEERITAGEKCARHALARRLYVGNYDITTPELEKLKTLIGKNFTTLIVGPCFEILDGKASAQEEVSANGVSEAAGKTKKKASGDSEAEKAEA